MKGGASLPGLATSRSQPLKLDLQPLHVGNGSGGGGGGRGPGSKKGGTLATSASAAAVATASPAAAVGATARGDAPYKKAATPKNGKKTAAIQQAINMVKDFMSEAHRAQVYLKEGKLALDAGDYIGAIECFNEGISCNPSILGFYTFRAVCHKALNMWTEAYFDYSFAVRLEPEVGAHFCLRGLCLSKLKKIGMALEDLDQAVSLDPSSQHYYTRASVLLEVQRYDNAIKDLSHAIELEKDSSSELKLKCYYRRATAYLDIGQHQKAIDDLNCILACDPNSAQTRVLLGRTYKKMDELRKAEEQLSLAIILDAEQSSYYIERGDIRFRINIQTKHIDAIYDFDKALLLLDKKLESLLSTGFKAKYTKTPKHVSPKPVLEAINIFSPAFAKANNHASLYDTIPGLQETEESIADALNRRAQAKLMIESTFSIIEEALVDAQKAYNILPQDDDYGLVVAICFIRLERYSDAVSTLKGILARSPENEKALYHMSYCQRFSGKKKDAIEGLTKIISISETGLIDGSGISIPIHRVYEARGTLFHEIQSHKLALKDLGKAIALNPDRAENFFLRANCHCKLGNYELAIEDYNLTEAKNFPDKCSLYLARGLVFRLLNDSIRASKDFEAALPLMDPRNKFSKTRILTMEALCLIDQLNYPKALSILLQALALVEEMVRFLIHGPESPPEVATGQATGSIPTPMLDSTGPPASPGNGDDSPLNLHKNAANTGFLEGDSLINTEGVESGELDGHREKYSSTLHDYLEVDPSEVSLVTLCRMQWILYFHCALCFYQQGDFESCLVRLEHCISEEHQQHTPDNFTLGIAYYFLGVTRNRLGMPELAESCLMEALSSKWVSKPHHKFLGLFSLAKTLQMKQDNKRAIEYFSLALEVEPDNPYVFFRRAWSYKALGDYIKSGDDFESAKNLKREDPNFSIDYKKIFHVKYMEIETEPDLMERFPVLLPTPGSI